MAVHEWHMLLLCALTAWLHAIEDVVPTAPIHVLHR